jgi:hypothetical protein
MLEHKKRAPSASIMTTGATPFHPKLLSFIRLGNYHFPFKANSAALAKVYP